MNSYIFKEPE